MWKASLGRSLALLVLALAAAGCAGKTSTELMGAAQQALANGQVRKAQIQLKNLLRDDPNNATARGLLGEVSAALGDPAAAEANFRRALKLGVEPASIQVPFVRSLLQQGKYQDALKQINNGPQLKGKNQVALLRLRAAAHRGLGQPDKADKDYKAALALAPDSLDVRAAYAGFLVQRRQYDDARKLVVKVLEKNPNFGPALMVRGRLEELSGHAADAADTFRQVIKAEGPEGRNYFSASAQLVNALLNEGSMDEAAKTADALLKTYPDNPVAIALKATVEVRQGKLDSARQRLERIVARAPKYGLANRLLGVINARQGRPGQAKMYLQAAVTNSPNDGRARLTLADLYLKEGNVDAAKKQLTEAFKPRKTKSDAVLFALAGRGAMRIHDEDLAADFFTQSASMLSGNPQELVAVSRVYAASGDIERAQKLLEGPSKSNSDTAWMATYMLALTQMQQRDLKTADATVQRLIAQQPDKAWPLNLRGLVAVMEKNLDTASQYYADALEVNSKYLPALLNLSHVQLLQNKPKAAAASFHKVLEIDPDQSAALLGLARLALANKNYAEAEKWLDKAPKSVARLRMKGQVANAEGHADEAADAFAEIFRTQPSAQAAIQAYAAAAKAGESNPDAPLHAWLAEHPQDPAVNLVLGQVALGADDQDAAINYFETVLKTTPKQVVALNNLAWLYGQKGDDQAVAYAKRAHEAAPDNPAVADTLGWLEVQQGDAEAGLSLLEQSHKAVPSNASIHYHYAAALAKTGSTDAAVAELQKLLAGDTRFNERGDAEKLLAQLQ